METAVEHGFDFHSIDGDPYWDESAYYCFTLQQIEDDLEELVPVAMGLENASDVLGEHLRIDGMGWGGAEDDVSASVGARLSARN